MAYKDIVVEKRGRIVCMTLNRPERMNSISVETGNEMLEVLTEYRDNPEQWVMIIAAAGQKSFCSGMYVTEAADKTAAKWWITFISCFFTTSASPCLSSTSSFS